MSKRPHSSISKNAEATETDELESDLESEADHEQKKQEKSIKKKKKYSQKLKPLILVDYPWATQSKKGASFVFCKACKIDLSIASGKIELSKHSNTKRHITSTTAIASNQSTLFDYTLLSKETALLDSVASAEIRQALFIAEHNLSIKLSDHLPQLYRKMFPDSEIAKRMACARTKTTAVIQAVTGRFQEENISKMLKTKKFSLIVDEVTDKSTKKHLAMIVRVRVDNKINDLFYDMIEVTEADAVGLHKIVVESFSKRDVPYTENLIGFAADSASVMMAKYNSIAAYLKKEISNLFVMACTCHSFNSSANAACAKLPNNIESFARDVHNHFCLSPKRVGSFKEFQAFVDIDQHKILSLSNTRWLSLENVVSRLIEQLPALKLYFTEGAFDIKNRSREQCAKILETINDPSTLLYLYFLQWVLPSFNTLNKLMQSERPQVHVISDKVKTTCLTLMESYMQDCFLRRDFSTIEFTNPRHFKPIEQIYLGANTAATIISHKIDNNIVNDFRVKCLGFLIESVTQILQRVNPVNPVYRNLEFLNPEIVLSRKKDSIVPLASLFPNLISTSNLQTLDNEWRLLRNTEFTVTEEEKTNVELFWKKIENLKTGDNFPAFPTLCNFMFNLLSLPHSSAACERIFSQLKLIKNDARNKLENPTICGLLYSKGLINDYYCYNFDIENNLICKMKNLNIHEKI